MSRLCLPPVPVGSSHLSGTGLELQPTQRGFPPGQHPEPGRSCKGGSGAAPGLTHICRFAPHKLHPDDGGCPRPL